jgi:hypothetical protein
LAKLDPFRSGGWWGQAIPSIFLLSFNGSFFRHASLKVGVESFAELLNVDLVDVQLQLTLELVQVLS